MASSEKSKKSHPKPPRNRPPATSLLTQPVVEDSSSLAALSLFSLNGNWFAFISLAIDKHRLRVYDTVTGQSVAEYVVDSARVTALTWSNFDPSEGHHKPTEDDSPQKKRKKRKSQAAHVQPPLSSAIEVVVLGLSNGSLSFFSPNHGRVLRTLSHSTSTSAILSVAFTNGEETSTIWTSGMDGAIRLWNARTNHLLGSWKTDDRIPYSSMATRPEVPAEEDGRMNILVANHGIHLLSISSSPSEITRKPNELASFTGHASSIVNLQWDASQKPLNRFLSAAEGDRFVYIWEIPDVQGPSKEGKIVASIPLDSDARSFSLSVSSSSASTIERQNLLTLSASGKISIYPIPSELTPPASSKKTEHKVPTLLPRSNISASSKKKGLAVQVVGASFAPGLDGHIRVARLVGGVRPIFKLISYLNESGDFIQDINVVPDDIDDLLAGQSQTTAPNKRYVEPSSLAVRSGVELGQDQEMGDLATRLDGDLDIDLAELSLGQRLTALSGADDALRTTTSDSDGATAPKPSKRSDKKQGEASAVPANSLTRTLIQALHSSDSRLLEACLAHSNQTLIRNTVRRLPPQLAVPLLIACAERLGRGPRAENMRGGGGAASSQRGAGLVAWVKAVLAVHSGHLMTIPDLVARLSGLYTTLTTRLTMQESLLSLSGRLDMVLSQIEMRSSIAPAPLAPQKRKQFQEVKLYVEGESEAEEQVDGEAEVENGDDAGSVEDVELGGNSQDGDHDEADETDEERSEEDEDDSDEEYGGGGPTMNGFIDDEAEESDEDDEDEDSE